MKIGFNESCDWFCKDHSVMRDLEYCEACGFDYIDLQAECLERDLASGRCSLEEMGGWFRNHRLKPLSYSALPQFNMKQTQAGKNRVMAELTEIIRRCEILGCKMISVVPSVDLPVPAAVSEIRADAVAALREMAELSAPHGIRLSLEFHGSPAMSVNQFSYAYDIVQQVDSPFVGVTLDQYHFRAMSSQWEDLERADGGKIFIWHLTGMEDMPCGAPYNTDEKRLWPGEPGDCLDHRRYADILKKIGFAGDVCTIKVLRPAYYELDQWENVRKAAEVARAHAAKYW